MIEGFADISIGVPDLEKAVSEYSELVGALPIEADHALLPLANVRIRLHEDARVKAALIDTLVLWAPENAELPADRRGLPLSVSTEREVTDSPTRTGIRAVDHIVLRSRDADDCIRLFGEELGMRLALDQQVPEWGGRMLFFRCGKLTLEVIQHLEDPVAEDHFWGLTYLCDDLEETLAALDARGVKHSQAREGRKPGTLVATVKSHNLGIPTLLIQPAPRN